MKLGWTDSGSIALQKEGIESHVVDANSIAAPRRRRRAKTDKIDGEALLRVLLAYKRSEPRVCSMVVMPKRIAAGCAESGRF
jgi:transposase